MKRLYLKFLISVYGFIVLLSCSAYDAQKHLNDIESYIMECPDSALTILDSMDRSLLTTDRLRAHHALLHAMALDKNYIDVTDDSIARVAVDYYSRKGPDKYEARALYYLGNTYYYASEYGKAILYYTKAEDVAEGVDELYLGMIKMAQADSYSYTYNHDEELKCLQESYKLFDSISDEYYLSLTKLRLAQVLFNKKQDAKADSLINELINSDSIDDKVLNAAMVTYAFRCAVKNNPDFVRVSELYADIVENHDDSYMSYQDYWVWAYALNRTGKKEVSQSLVNKLKRDTSATGYYWQYMIAKLDGRIDDALYLLEKTSTKHNDEVEEALKQSLSSVQRDFYISQSEISEYKAHNRKLLLMITIIISILIITVILWSVLIYVKKREVEKESYLKYADEIHRQLEDARNDNYPELKRKYLTLYQSRFETIGALYEQYSLSHGKKNEEKAIYDKVVALVGEFRNDYQDVEMFETVLNKDLDGIMENLRSDMPGFKETDFAIFRFLLIGFDVTVISHLLNMSMNAIYIRKSRMRKQIEDVDPVRKNEYMEVLDLKSPFKEKL